MAIFNGGNALATVNQLAIDSGPTVGGLLFDSTGERGTFMASVPVLLLAAYLAFLTSRSQGRHAA